MMPLLPVGLGVALFGMLTATSRKEESASVEEASADAANPAAPAKPEELQCCSDGKRSRASLVNTFLITLGLTLAQGCAITQSMNVKTSGMHVEFSVTGNSQNQATAQATFQVGGASGTYVELSSGDTVTCDGIPLQKVQVPLLNSLTYVSAMPYIPGKSYTFVFTRANEGSYSATVILPPAPVISAPLDNASIRIGQAFAVNWVAANDTMDLQLNKGSSGSYVQTPLSDVGTYWVPGSATQGALANSQATLTLTRMRSGTFPIGFQSGSSVGKQAQSITLMLVP